MTLTLPTLEEVRAELARRKAGQTIEEQAEVWARSLRGFVRAAWPVVVPNPIVESWHIDAVCDHLQACYERDIRRLIITIPPGTGKSTLVSVIAPAWRWIRAPDERFITASWSSHFAERDTRASRNLIRSQWFQTRFRSFALSADENLKTRYSNDQGGRRVASYVGGGTGERGDVLILDDPHNAQEMHSDNQLQSARSWWGDTWASRLNDSPERPGAMIVIGQRIHQNDVIGMLLEDGRWTHLCLPARYEQRHRHRTPARVDLASGKTLHGDPRTKEGELLAPNYLTEARLDELATDMTAHVAAGQLQQRPAPKEGSTLQRSAWRYYPPSLSFYSRDGRFEDREARRFDALVQDAARKPIDEIVHTWDTSLKDGAKNDYVAGQVWARAGAHRYLLRLFKDRVGLNGIIEAMLEFYDWAVLLWPSVPQHVLIENAATGPDAAREIKKRVDGVVKITARGSKELRAAAAAPALEGGNCFLPGYQDEAGGGYDPRTPARIQDFVESCSVFPNGSHDDDVDAWSQMVNWTRLRGSRSRARTSKPTGRWQPGSLQGARGW